MQNLIFWLILCYYSNDWIIYLHFCLKEISFMYRNEANHHWSRSYWWSLYFITQIANNQIYKLLRHVFYIFYEHHFVYCQQYRYYSGVLGTEIYKSLLRCLPSISYMHVFIYLFIFFIYLGVVWIVSWIILDRCICHILYKRLMANQKKDCWYNI